MRNRWVDALIKTVIFLVVAHIILLLLGFFMGNDIGIFSLPMIWAHWSDNLGEACLGVVATVIVYFVIYGCFTGKDERIEKH